MNNALIAWLRHTKAVQIREDSDPSAATDEEFPWQVHATNGDPEFLASSLLARCASQIDAELVASAVRMAQQGELRSAFYEGWRQGQQYDFGFTDEDTTGQHFEEYVAQLENVVPQER
jgi:hypothetical protein